MRNDKKYGGSRKGSPHFLRIFFHKKSKSIFWQFCNEIARKNPASETEVNAANGCNMYKASVDLFRSAEFFILSGTCYIT